MRKAEVYLFGKRAGFIEEKEPRGYRFWYDAEYLGKADSIPLSPLMPLTSETVESEALPAFFDGLIPEGWLLDIAEQSWKISARDRFSLLLARCKDCIGNVSVIPMERKEDDNE